MAHHKKTRIDKEKQSVEFTPALVKKYINEASLIPIPPIDSGIVVKIIMIGT